MARTLSVFLIGTFGIACAAIFVRLALPAPPVVSAFYRIAFAMLVLWSWLLGTGRWQRPAPRILWSNVIAGLCFGADMALWNTAVVETSVANATLLVNTTPILVGLWAITRRQERLELPLLAGGGLALLGGLALVGGDLDIEGALFGDGLALGAALFYAAYLLIMKEVRHELDAVRAVAIAGLSSMAVLGVIAWLRGDPFVGFPASSWWIFALAAAVSHLGGVLGIVWALRELRATFAAIALLAQPLGTALLGWWILGEALSPVQLLGGSLVMAGILLAARVGRG